MNDKKQLLDNFIEQSQATLPQQGGVFYTIELNAWRDFTIDPPVPLLNGIIDPALFAKSVENVLRVYNSHQMFSVMIFIFGALIITAVSILHIPFNSILC
jgi:hypothetical protein